MLVKSKTLLSEKHISHLLCVNNHYSTAGRFHNLLKIVKIFDINNISVNKSFVMRDNSKGTKYGILDLIYRLNMPKFRKDGLISYRTNKIVEINSYVN